jgi:spore coat protein CotH
MRNFFRLKIVLLVLAVLVSVFSVNLIMIQAENASKTAFTISNITPAHNEFVTFEAMSASVQADDTTSYQWDFGDGTTAFGKQVTHAFATVADFKVCLTVTDNNNHTDTISNWVFVGRPRSWTKKTHQSADGYYEVVFPEDKVLRMDITLSAKNYQVMEDDLSNSAGTEGNDPVYVPVTIKFNNCIWRNVGMRYTKNNTLALLKQAVKHKYPFVLNFNKLEADYPETKGQNFFGFKQLLCDNNWADASFVMNVACSDIFRAGGVPTARGSFYRMFLNTGDGPVYLGLYSVFEQPEDQMLKAQFVNGDGNIYKLDGKEADWLTRNQDAFETDTNQAAADRSPRNQDAFETDTNQAAADRSPRNQDAFETDTNQAAADWSTRNQDAFETDTNQAAADRSPRKLVAFETKSIQAAADRSPRKLDAFETKSIQAAADRSPRKLDAFETKSNQAVADRSPRNQDAFETKSNQAVADRSPRNQEAFETKSNQAVADWSPRNQEAFETKSNQAVADWSPRNQDAFETNTNQAVADRSPRKLVAFETKSNQEAVDWSDVRAVFAAFNADRLDATAWRAGLEAVFDVKIFLRWLAINNAIIDTANNGFLSQNYYLYQNLADEGRLVWIPQDFNLPPATTWSSGPGEGDTGAVSTENSDGTAITISGSTKTSMSDRDGTDAKAGSPALQKAAHNWPLIRFLMADPVYNKIYKTELRKALLGCLNELTLTAKIRRMHEMVRPYVVGPEGESATYSYLTNGEAEFDKALTAILAQISNRQTAVKKVLGLSIPVSTAAPPRQISRKQNYNQAVAKPLLSKQKNDIDPINQSEAKVNVATVNNNNNDLITEKVPVKVIKIVPTVFTVFFMVMLVFGALACCNGRKRLKTKKKIRSDQWTRPPMGQQGQQRNRSANGKDQWPVPEVAPLINKPTSVLGRNFNRQSLPYEQR